MVGKKSSGRNRSEGWKWAKRTGHENEDDIVSRLKNDERFARAFGQRIFGRSIGVPSDVSGGGSSAKQVEDIFGKHTNGKPDIYLRWDNEPPVNVSVKKSMSGQVFLTSVDRFITGFEHQYGESIPEKVSSMLHLFIGTDPDQCDLIMKGLPYLGPNHRDGNLLEKHQHRILSITLSQHFPDDWNATIEWVRSHAGQIADFSFSRGYAKSKTDFATHVWYYMPDNSEAKIDRVIPINEIVDYCNSRKIEVAVGSRYGGSTIHFPFGFLQMHSPQGDNQLQFHHNFSKISHLGR